MSETTTAKKTTATKKAVATKKVAEMKPFEKTLHEAAKAFANAEKATTKGGTLLWQGTQEAYEAWDASKDEDGTGLYESVKGALGESRKGDASKIRTVALAAKAGKIDLDDYDSLSKAYTAATEAGKKAEARDEEDRAADEAVQSLNAPDEATTAEAAAKIVLESGVDDAARILLDTLGPDNVAAHRAFARAVSEEIAGRITEVKKAEAAKKKKAEAEKKKAEREAQDERKAQVAAEQAEKARAQRAAEEVDLDAQDDLDLDLDVAVSAEEFMAVAPKPKAAPKSKGAAKKAAVAAKAVKAVAPKAGA